MHCTSGLRWVLEGLFVLLMTPNVRACPRGHPSQCTTFCVQNSKGKTLPDCTCPFPIVGLPLIKLALGPFHLAGLLRLLNAWAPPFTHELRVDKGLPPCQERSKYDFQQCQQL